MLNVKVKVKTEQPRTTKDETNLKNGKLLKTIYVKLDYHLRFNLKSKLKMSLLKN